MNCIPAEENNDFFCPFGLAFWNLFRKTTFKRVIFYYLNQSVLTTFDRERWKCDLYRFLRHVKMHVLKYSVRNNSNETALQTFSCHFLLLFVFSNFELSRTVLESYFTLMSSELHSCWRKQWHFFAPFDQLFGISLWKLLSKG